MPKAAATSLSSSDEGIRISDESAILRTDAHQSLLQLPLSGGDSLRTEGSGALKAQFSPQKAIFISDVASDNVSRRAAISMNATENFSVSTTSEASMNTTAKAKARAHARSGGISADSVAHMNTNAVTEASASSAAGTSMSITAGATVGEWLVADVENESNGAISQVDLPKIESAALELTVHATYRENERPAHEITAQTVSQSGEIGISGEQPSESVQKVNEQIERSNGAEATTRAAALQTRQALLAASGVAARFLV